MECDPSVIVSEETFQDMAKGLGPQLTYDQWAGLQEHHSLKVQKEYFQKEYFEEANAHDRDVAEYKESLAQSEEDVADEEPDEEPDERFLDEPIPKESWVVASMMIFYVERVARCRS